MAPAGNLVASANDMARYAAMLLAGGAAPGGRLLEPESVAQLLAPGSPPGHARLLSADFDFRYGEGWFVGPFGAAADARWHLGSLSSFAAWMVLLPDTKQAVVLLINANNELPVGDINAAMSRLPIGVVNLLRGQPPPTGPSLRSAYLVFDAVIVLLAAALAALAWWAARTRRGVWPALMLLVAVGLVLLPRSGRAERVDAVAIRARSAAGGGLVRSAARCARVGLLLAAAVIGPARSPRWPVSGRRRNDAPRYGAGRPGPCVPSARADR